MSRLRRRDLIAALGSAFRAQQRATDALDDAAALYFGVNRTDLRCLDVILEQGSATPSALAESLGITSGSVTTMLDRLTEAGYVERSADAADRRRVAVRPTAKAEVAAKAVYEPVAREGQQLLARYTIAELEAFLDFLHRNRALQEAHAGRVRQQTG